MLGLLATVKGMETSLALKRRARRINRILAEAYPNAQAELNFTNALELIVATVLSAQCTDVRVNQVTPALFERYPTAADYAHADPEELGTYIRSTGFFRAKAKNLIGLGAMLDEDFDGEVPPRLEDLVKLPGVGRKTANVVLGNAFGIPGLTVDTHFGRIVRRLGLTHDKDPVKVEHALEQLIEKREWTLFSHRVIFHGRRVCHSRKAACGVCFLAKQCPSYGKVGPTEIPLAQALVKSPDREHLFHMAGVNDEN